MKIIVNELINFEYCVCVCFMLLVTVAGSNPPALQMSVSWVYCVVLGRYFCDYPTTRRKESCRVLVFLIVIVKFRQ